MSNSHYTEIQTKILDVDGPFAGAVTVVANHSDIAIGNHELMFDKSLQKYYKFNSDGSTYDALPIKTDLDGS